jgi:hypothetical protein
LVCTNQGRSPEVDHSRLVALRASPRVRPGAVRQKRSGQNKSRQFDAILMEKGVYTVSIASALHEYDIH